MSPGAAREIVNYMQYQKNKQESVYNILFMLHFQKFYTFMTNTVIGDAQSFYQIPGLVTLIRQRLAHLFKHNMSTNAHILLPQESFLLTRGFFHV